MPPRRRRHKRWSMPPHKFSKPGVRAAGETGRAGDGPNWARPAAPSHITYTGCFLGRLGRGQQAGRWGRVGWAPRQPLPQERYTLMHMHTHAPREHARPPPLGLWGKAGLCLPSPTGKEPRKWGMRRPLAQPGEPQSPTPLCPPAESRGLWTGPTMPCSWPCFLSTEHSGWRGGSAARAQANEEGVRGVEVCLVSDPKAWGCLGMGGGYDMKGLHGALKGRGFSMPSLPRALTLQRGVVTPVPSTF